MDVDSKGSFALEDGVGTSRMHDKSCSKDWHAQCHCTMLAANANEEGSAWLLLRHYHAHMRTVPAGFIMHYINGKHQVALPRRYVRDCASTM